MNKDIIKIENVSLTYKNTNTKALDDFSLKVKENEILGLVGESGCGKSTLGRAIIGLEKFDEGNIYLDGENLDYSKDSELKKLRENIQMVFQDPYLSLDPSMSVKNIINEPLKYLKASLSKEEKEKRILEVMKLIDLDINFLDRKSKEMSGGQRQRVGIARALAITPKVLICDEPVSSLDVSVQAGILNLLKNLKKDLNLSLIFISHDLSVVNYIADRVCVMLKGKVCEIGSKDDIFNNPKHPYSKFLLESVPKIQIEEENEISDDLMEIEYNEKGCPFYNRCELASEICAKEFPKISRENEHIWYCHNNK